MPHAILGVARAEPRVLVVRGVAVAAVMAMTVACSQNSTDDIDSGRSGAAATYVMDWAEYDSVEQLASQAQLAVLVELQEGEGAWDIPDYSSDDPRVNPYAGTGHTPSKAEIEAAALPVTRFSAQVLRVSEGGGSATAEVEAGSVMIIQQPGGTVDGERYVVSDIQPLSSGERVLLFVRESPFVPGVFVILGGPAGTFRTTEDGVLVSDRGGLRVSPEQLDAVVGKG